MINVSRRKHVINPKSIPPPYRQHEKSLHETSHRARRLEPLDVEYSIAWLVIAEENLLREKPSLLVELVHQAFKANKSEKV